MRARRRYAKGLTLVELVVAMTIIAVAIASVLAALSGSSVNSANRMVRQQAAAIAQAYLEEIVQKPFNDPDGIAEGPARNLHDNVADYNGPPDNPALDQAGAAIPNGAAYTVTTQVQQGVMTGIPAAQVLLVTVTVRHTNGITVVANGYKTNY